ncbi:hypothetical protein T492DRAFT_1034799 [Pavlovales sp. CCMP2436]|nr:hypothetical protein T492DRAFT_1034799 [Pavlovales sp. CCMP2436]
MSQLTDLGEELALVVKLAIANGCGPMLACTCRRFAALVKRLVSAARTRTRTRENHGRAKKRPMPRAWQVLRSPSSARCPISTASRAGQCRHLRCSSSRRLSPRMPSCAPTRIFRSRRDGPARWRSTGRSAARFAKRTSGGAKMCLLLRTLSQMHRQTSRTASLGAPASTTISAAPYSRKLARMRRTTTSFSLRSK